MKKIVIVSFYELKDYFLYIKELFEKYLFTVTNYPLFRYAYDANDKIENYKEHMNDFIKKENPDIILWWFIDVPVDVFKFIKHNNQNKIFILYNSDDPVNLTQELFNKAKIFDIVMSPCKETLYLYKLYANVKKVIFCPMGYDPTLFTPRCITSYDSQDFECDISMITYNLYGDDSFYDQMVNKLKMIEDIIKLSDIKGYKFKLYGTPILRELFPTHYHGEIPYYKLNFLFNSSKINIVTSPFKDKSLYVNEYVMPILGCGGLLMHDNVKDIDKILIDGVNCVLYDDSNYIDKIDNVLDNYCKYKDVKIAGSKVAHNFTWNTWTEIIVKNIGKMTFDKKTYAELYDLDENEDLYRHWVNAGIHDGHICYNFEVPETFDSDAYISKIKMENATNKKAYLHWLLYSKDNIYMKKSNDNKVNFNPKEYNIIMEDYFNVCTLFNKVGNYHTRDEGLKELDKYCKQVPYIKVNELLNKYSEMVI